MEPRAVATAGAGQSAQLSVVRGGVRRFRGCNCPGFVVKQPAANSATESHCRGNAGKTARLNDRRRTIKGITDKGTAPRLPKCSYGQIRGASKGRVAGRAPRRDSRCDGDLQLAIADCDALEFAERCPA